MAEGTVWVDDGPGLGVCVLSSWGTEEFSRNSEPTLRNQAGLWPQDSSPLAIFCNHPMASVLRSPEKSATSSLGSREWKVMMDGKLATARLSTTDQECFPSLFRTLPSLEEEFVSTEAVRRDQGS